MSLASSLTKECEFTLLSRKHNSFVAKDGKKVEYFELLILVDGEVAVLRTLDLVVESWTVGEQVTAPLMLLTPSQKINVPRVKLVF